MVTYRKMFLEKGGRGILLLGFIHTLVSIPKHVNFRENIEFLQHRTSIITFSCLVYFQSQLTTEQRCQVRYETSLIILTNPAENPQQFSLTP